MAWLRSPPAFGIPWRDTLVAGVAAVMIPAALGLVLVGLFRLFGDQVTSETALSLWGASMLLMVSPLMSGPGMIMVLPVAGILLREGWFGWMPALALGLAIGGLIGQAAQFPPGMAFGAVILLIMRTTLGRLRAMG